MFDDGAKLYLSFWDMCLENLPQGIFSCRQMKPAGARRAIARARKDKSLLCVTKADLLAPYCERERDQHSELCNVLTKEFGIPLTLADFGGDLEDDEGSLQIANPLCFAQVRGKNRLLVVTCMYALKKGKRKDPLAMKVEPSTVRFYLIETTKS